MEDGFSDPPGIKVRPREGLEGIDYMADGFLRPGTFIFGKLIKNLIDVGYDKKMLFGCPYDWRLPPQKIEERDKCVFPIFHFEFFECIVTDDAVMFENVSIGFSPK
jgi:hypothetical protein